MSILKTPGTERLAWDILAAVPDPEIPALSVVDLGIVRGVELDGDGRISVTITPTYSGCPATFAIREDVQAALATQFQDVVVNISLAPAWTTDWITPLGRQRLEAYGIAPPHPDRGGKAGSGRPLACPQCGATETERVSQFGSTPCKALYRCLACREPFDYFKCL